MALLFKTNATYVGTSEAKHILELLGSSSEKLDYITRLLSSIKTISSYPNESNIDAIVDKLLAHVRRVQKAGARVLSVAYTLKAILFVMQNSLSDAEFIATSPDFGVAYTEPDKKITKLFSLNGLDLISTTSVLGGLYKTDNFNTVSRLGASNAIYRSNQKIQINQGIILGRCDILSKTTGTSAGVYISVTDLTDQSVTADKIYSPAAVRLVVPTSATLKSTVTATVASRELLNASGLVAKYEYGTTSNKLYMNNAEVIQNSDANIMYDLSASSAALDVWATEPFIIEAWLINSKNELLAKSLSSHLNRRDMLPV